MFPFSLQDCKNATDHFCVLFEAQNRDINHTANNFIKYNLQLHLPR